MGQMYLVYFIAVHDVMFIIVSWMPRYYEVNSVLGSGELSHRNGLCVNYLASANNARDSIAVAHELHNFGFFKLSVIVVTSC